MWDRGGVLGSGQAKALAGVCETSKVCCDVLCNDIDCETLLCRAIFQSLLRLIGYPFFRKRSRTCKDFEGRRL